MKLRDSGFVTRGVAAAEIQVPSDGRSFAVLVDDISADGLFASTFHDVDEGERIIVELALGDGPLRVAGVVEANMDPERAGFFVRFEELPLGDVVRLAVYAAPRWSAFPPLASVG